MGNYLLFSIFTILFNTFKISPATVAASIDVFLPSLTIQPSKGKENEPWLAFTPECIADNSSIKMYSLRVFLIDKLSSLSTTFLLLLTTSQSGETDTLAPKPAWPVGLTPNFLQLPLNEVN